MRLGTAEFYRVVEELPEVVDSLVVHLEDPAGGNGELLLFVRLRDGVELDDALRRRDRHRAAHRAVAAAHPRRDRRRAGGAAQPDRQEAGAAGEEDPARGRARTRSPAATCSPTRPPLDAFVALRRGPVNAVERVAVVATGVIGASWAAHFLARGLDVVATDPAPGAEERLRADVAAHWPTLERIGLVEGASPERLTFTADPADGRRGGGLRPGERSRARGRQARAVRRARRGRPPGRRAGLQLVRHAAHGDRPRLPRSTPSGCWSGTRSTRRTSSRWSRSCPGEQTSDGGRRAGDGVLHRGRQAPDPAAPGAARPRRQPAAGRAVAGGLLPGRAGRRLGRRHRHRHLPGPRPALGGARAVRATSTSPGGPGGLAHVLEHLGPPTEAWWRDLRLRSTLTPELVASWSPASTTSSRASTRPSSSRGATPSSTPCSPPRRGQTCPDEIVAASLDSSRRTQAP